MTPETSDPVLRRRRVLVVDDDRDVVATQKLILEMLDQQVACAYTGEEALRIAPAFRPELVLLDIGMMGMSGIEVARRLRKLPGLAGATILAHSGTADFVQADSLAVFDGLLPKPVAIETLLTVLGEPAPQES